MAAIPSTSTAQQGDFVVSKITLGASDTLTYSANTGQYRYSTTLPHRRLS